MRVVEVIKDRNLKLHLEKVLDREHRCLVTKARYTSEASSKHKVYIVTEQIIKELELKRKKQERFSFNNNLILTSSILGWGDIKTCKEEEIASFIETSLFQDMNFNIKDFRTTNPINEEQAIDGKFISNKSFSSVEVLHWLLYRLNDMQEGYDNIIITKEIDG